MKAMETKQHLVRFSLMISLGAVLLLLILAAGAGEAEGKTITVDDDGGADHTTIQAAIDAAESGDTVYVFSGTYSGGIAIAKTVDLIGEDKNTTILTSAVKITADNCRVSGFNVSSGYGGIEIYKSGFHTISDNIIDTSGHGIDLDDSSHNIITNNTILDSCIYLSASSCEYNTISNNSISSSFRYSICLWMTAHNTLSNNQMKGRSIFITGGLKSWNTLSIDTSNTVDGKPVYFYRNTTGITVPSGAGQVILANCTNMTVKDQSFSDSTAGILAAYSSNNLIQNNTITNTSYSFSFFYCDNNILSNNSIVGGSSSGGMSLRMSNHNRVSNNSIVGGSSSGISIRSGDSNTITSNLVKDNGGSGIYVEGSWSRIFGNTIINNSGSNQEVSGIYLMGHSNTVSDNILENNSCGITLYGRSMTISGNKMKENGLFCYGSQLQYWNTHTITSDNSVNGKNVLYYSNETGLTVPFGAGQVIFANCSNMRVENQDLSNGTVGVLAGFSSYVTISNITISNKVRVDSRYLYYSNIYLDNCDNSTVSNCKTSGNNRNIHLQRSYNNTLSGNTVLDSDYGIRLDRSNNNTISSNIISENDVGIYIEGSCQNTSVHHNSIYGNTGYGIRVSSYDSSFIDATDNWWGARTGPRHSINNSRGDGDVVSDYVTFDPWADKNLLAATIIDSISPNPAWDTDTVEFKGHAADDTVVDRYVWTSSLDGEIHNSTECNFTSSSLSPGEHRIYLKVQDNNKAWSEEVSTSLTILKDSDRDGVIDEEDAFPADPVASKDSDGDGYPDSWNPGKTEEDSTTDLKLDAYPDDPDKWEKEEEDDSPGFGVLLMVLVLVGAGLVRKSASSSNKRTKQ